MFSFVIEGAVYRVQYQHDPHSGQKPATTCRIFLQSNLTDERGVSYLTESQVSVGYAYRWHKDPFDRKLGRKMSFRTAIWGLFPFVNNSIYDSQNAARRKSRALAWNAFWQAECDAEDAAERARQNHRDEVRQAWIESVMTPDAQESIPLVGEPEAA